MLSRWVSIGIVIACAVLTACGSGGEFPSAGSHPVLGKPAPDFTLENVEGQSVSLAAHQGKDVVVLDFWASWCGPCVQGLPLLSDLAEGYEGKPVAFYAVNLQENRDQVRAFLSRVPLKFPVLLDTEGQVADRYDVEAIPLTVVIDTAGRVQALHRGYSPELPQDLGKEIDRLLSGSNILE